MVKQKLGLLLFSFLTVISAGLSVYFFEKEIIFSIGFAVVSVICILCAYSEFLYEKNKKIIIDEETFPKEIIINYSTLSQSVQLLGYLIFIIGGIYFISLVGFDYKKYEGFEYVMIAIAFYLIITYLYKIVRVLKKSSEKDVLIICNDGIVLNSEKMLWNHIKNEKIIKKQEYVEHSKYKVDVQYLSLMHQNKNIDFKIDELDHQDYLIEQYLKVFRERFQKTNFRHENLQKEEKETFIFENILKINDLFLLSEKERGENLENISLLAQNNPSELKKYCESILDFTDTNLDSIYYALSEKGNYFEDFLANEFIRLFEAAKKSKDSKEVFNILDEIYHDGESSSASKKVTDYLYQELSNIEDRIRLKALNFINLWLNEEDISKGNTIIQKMKMMIKDRNWKIRWCANNILSSYNIFQKDEIAISFQDKLNAKFNNQYEID